VTQKYKTQGALGDLTEKRRYCKLNEAALDQTLWRSRFGRGYGQVARRSTL